LSTAITLAPADTDLCYNIGFLKFKQGHNDEALAILEKIVKMSPHHTDALVHIGLIYQEKGVLRCMRD
jgi:tetratricopeptide (TPR) repeat protein